MWGGGEWGGMCVSERECSWYFYLYSLVTQGTLTEGEDSVRLTSLYRRLIFILKILIAFVTKHGPLMRRSTVIGLPFHLVFPGYTNGETLIIQSSFKEGEVYILFGHCHKPWNTNWRERFSTVDLLVKIAYNVRKDKKLLVKSSWSKLVSTRSSTVPRLPLQEGFYAQTILWCCQTSRIIKLILFVL